MKKLILLVAVVFFIVHAGVDIGTKSIGLHAVQLSQADEV